jgi:hypothetical protein
MEVNMIAAAEIARQLRLRHWYGIGNYRKWFYPENVSSTSEEMNDDKETQDLTPVNLD